MGNLSLYVAREPPSTSLATVLALKDRSFTCRSFASRTRSLATPFTHSLESDSFTADFLEDRSFFTLLLLPAGSAATDGAYYHIYRKKRSVAIRTTVVANHQAIESAYGVGRKQA